MRRCIPVWRSLRAIVPLLIFGIAGCEPGTTTTSPEGAEFVAPQLAAAIGKRAVPGGTDPIVAELLRIIPGLPPRARTLGECKTRIRIPRSPRNSAFRAGRITLTFAPEMIEASGGKTTNYRFWRVVQDSDGLTLLRFADCLIPRTAGAIDQTWAWFTQPVGPKRQASVLELTGDDPALGELLATIATWLGPQKLFASQDECGIEFPEGCYLLDGILVEGCPSGETFDTGQGKCLPSGSPPPPGGETVPPTEGGGCDPLFETCPDPGSGGGPAGGTPPPGENPILGPFTLSCDAVVRGSVGVCRVTPPEGASTWSATFSWAGPGAGTTYEGTEWSAIMVSGGTMSATVHHAGIDTALDPVTWTVNARSAQSFGWANAVSASQTGGPPNVRAIVPSPSDAGVWGWVCSKIRGCPSSATAPTNLVHPDWTNGGGAGLIKVPDGPNKDLYYVASASYGMNLGAGYNIHVLPSGPKLLTLTSSVDLNACDGVITPEPSGTIKVNTFNYNAACKEAAGWTTMVTGLTAHENDHISRALAAAQSVDPRMRIEKLTNTNLATLKTAVQDMVFIANTDLRDRVNVTHNPPQSPWFIVTAWLWNATFQRFEGPGSISK